MTLLTDILKGLVESQKMYNTLGKAINFEAGNEVQVTRQQTLKEQGTASKYLKYPLVWLVTPFTVDHNGAGQQEAQDIKIIIAERTETELTTLQRETQIFKPVLIPIYEKLLQLISTSGKFGVLGPASIKHKHTFFHYWGKNNEANIFSDFVDVIEIKNLNLIINENCL